MKTLIAALLCSVSCAIAAADGGATGQLTLALHQSAALPGHAGTIKFMSYRDDRCPADVQCIVAGDAEVVMRVSRPGAAAQSVTLPWSGGEPGSAPAVQAAGLHLRLVSLEPRPLEHAKLSPSRYRAVIAVD